MKTTIALILATLLTSFLNSNAQQSEVEETKPPVDNLVTKQIRIYTEKIEIAAIEYAELMTTASNSNDHTKLRNTLFSMVKSGKAKLISNHSLTCRDRDKATAESVREFIYATEQEPAEFIQPNEIHKNVLSDLKFPIMPPTPVAFEQRNLGYTLELQPTLGEDGKTIDVLIAPESVMHVGDNIISDWDTEFAKLKVLMPIFYTERVNTIITLVDGEFLLSNTFSPEKDGKPDHSRIILHFIRAEILKVTTKN